LKKELTVQKMIQIYYLADRVVEVPYKPDALNFLVNRKNAFQWRTVFRYKPPLGGDYFGYKLDYPGNDSPAARCYGKGRTDVL
jgi:hypothetical protein